jgi:hypothetical protein
VREWELLAGECGDARPKERTDILKALQAARARLRDFDAALTVDRLANEEAARKRSMLALAAGSHVAAGRAAQQAEQSRLEREERERQVREQELARETPESALGLLGERLRALPAGQLRRLLDLVCPALHLAPGVPCVACGRPTPDSTPAADPGAPVVAVAPPVVAAPASHAVAAQDAPGPRARPQAAQGLPPGVGAAVGPAAAPQAAPGARRVIGAPRVPGGDQ